MRAKLKSIHISAPFATTAIYKGLRVEGGGRFELEYGFHNVGLTHFGVFCSTVGMEK